MKTRPTPVPSTWPLLFLGALAGSAVGCGHTTPAEPVTPPATPAAPSAPAATAATPEAKLAPKTVRADASSNGKTLEASVGDTIELSLEENPSTGYMWSASKEPAAEILKVESAEFHNSPSATGGPPMVGAGGTRVWTLRAIGAGTATVNLQLLPPASKKPAETFVLSVHVGG